MTGRAFTLVGASGAGKDTLLAALRRARPGLHIVRRVVTRPEAVGGEPFEGVSVAEFERRRGAGGFALSWRAHGLRYGIPVLALDLLAQGRDVLFNGSRAVLGEAAAVFPGLVVLHLTARPEVLADRLARRGRESAADIARRLERASMTLPDGLNVTEIDNSGAPATAVKALLAVLDRPDTHARRAER